MGSMIKSFSNLNNSDTAIVVFAFCVLLFIAAFLFFKLNKTLKKPANDKFDGQIQERDFIYIWYKITEIRNTSGGVFKSFSTPCRTVIKATSVEEAETKLTNFAASKTKLLFMTEEEWKKSGSDGDNLFKQFEELNKKFEKMMDNYFFKTYK